MKFKNRKQAALALSRALKKFAARSPLVLGIPRGGVPMAQIIANELKGDFDIVLVHKVSAPGNSEYALGSVSELGDIYISNRLGENDNLLNYVHQTANDEIKKLEEKRRLYSPWRAPVSPRQRTVIIVDDGIATGSTMIAAVRAIRSQQPNEIIIATPVISPHTLDFLEKESDDLIALHAADDFFSVGECYDDFDAIRDSEVTEILSQARAKKSA